MGPISAHTGGQLAVLFQTVDTALQECRDDQIVIWQLAVGEVSKGMCYPAIADSLPIDRLDGLCAGFERRGKFFLRKLFISYSEVSPGGVMEVSELTNVLQHDRVGDGHN